MAYVILLNHKSRLTKTVEELDLKKQKEANKQTNKHSFYLAELNGQRISQETEKASEYSLR